MPRTMHVFFLALSLAGLASLSGCGDEELLDPDGSLRSATWRATSDGYVIRGTVQVDTLTIEPGATVCGHPGAILHVPVRLEAVGTAEAPIVFRACDPEKGWGGLRVSPEWNSEGSGHLRHVLIEHADTGVHGWNLQIEHARIRQSRGPAVTGAAELTSTVVDTACTAQSHCAAIYPDRYGFAHLTDVIVRGSNGDGVARDRRAMIRLKDVVIEGNRGVGLGLGIHITHNDGPDFSVEGSLIITGNRAPASLMDHDLPILLPTSDSHEWLLGNEDDRLYVGIGNQDKAGLVVRAELPWTIFNGGSAVDPSLGDLAFEPGASITADPTHPLNHDNATFHLPAGRRIEGTESDPITFSGITLRVRGEPGETTRLRHVRFADGAVLSMRDGEDETPASDLVVVEQAEFDGARIEISAPGARIEDVRFRGASAAGERKPALRLAAAGLVARDIVIENVPGAGVEIAADDVLLSGCWIHGAGEDAIRVLEGAGIRVRDCGVEGSGWHGLNNTHGDTVDATGNWWGDANGPEAAGGESVVGKVVYTPWRTEPVPPSGGTP